MLTLQQPHQAQAKEDLSQTTQASPTTKLKGPTITLSRGKSGIAAASEQAAQGQEGLTFFGRKVHHLIMLQ